MDENYLDNLLNELSKNDGQQNNFDKNMLEDSGVDIDFSDIEDISLDELDEFDDIDLSSLELDDIDFDDVDVTKLDNDTATKISGSTDDDDFDMGTLMEEEPSEEQEEQSYGLPEDDFFFGDDAANADVAKEADDAVTEDIQENNAFADNEVFKEADTAIQMDEDLLGMAMNEDLGSLDNGNAANVKTDNVSALADDDIPTDVENMDLDDLFSALGIDDDDSSSGEDYTSNQDEYDNMFNDAMENDPDALYNTENIPEKETKPEKSKGKKGKKSLSVILFGEPDEDDEEEERLLQQKKAQKEDKKSQKEVIKAEKKTKGDEKKSLKQKKKQEIKAEKDKKKKERLAEINAEAEAEKNEKKLPTAVVIIVFAAFIALGALVVLGSKHFDYTQVIRKATDYFERQRYRLAYDEVSGVDVKDKDKDLKDRIYTVMYVERLYESYENNMSLNRPDKALDALLRGLEKYEVHYDEAVQLGIVEDIDACKAKIVAALWETYGISEEEAYSIMILEGQEYSSKLLELSADLMKY